MKLLGMVWRALVRDTRAGELRLLFVAVSLGVAALSSVGFLADRIESGLQRDARQLLGGDAVLVSDRVFSAEVLEKIKQFGLRSVTTLTFPTMARSGLADGGNSRLVALKAVSEGYPLRGQLQVLLPLDQPLLKPALVKELSNETLYDRPSTPTRDIPATGEVWVEPAILEALEIKLGDEILLGERTLKVARVLTSEPPVWCNLPVVSHGDWPWQEISKHCQISRNGLRHGSSKQMFVVSDLKHWRQGVQKCAKPLNVLKNSCIWWPCWPHC